MAQQHEEHEDGGTSLTAGDGTSVSVPTPQLTHDERVEAAPEDGGRLLLNAYGRACYRAGEFSMARRLESRRKELGICTDVSVSSRVCELGSQCCTVHHTKGVCAQMPSTEHSAKQVSAAHKNSDMAGTDNSGKITERG